MHEDRGLFGGNRARPLGICCLHRFPRREQAARSAGGGGRRKAALSILAVGRRLGRPRSRPAFLQQSRLERGCIPGRTGWGDGRRSLCVDEPGEGLCWRAMLREWGHREAVVCQGHPPAHGQAGLPVEWGVLGGEFGQQEGGRIGDNLPSGRDGGPPWFSPGLTSTAVLGRG